MDHSIELGNTFSYNGLRCRYELKRSGDGKASVWVTIDPDRLSGSHPLEVSEDTWPLIKVNGRTLDELVKAYAAG